MECNCMVNKPIQGRTGCAAKKDCKCSCGLRTVSDENHEPRVGFSCNVIVYDPINNRKYLYDSNGIYTDITGSKPGEHEPVSFDKLVKISDYLYEADYNDIDYEYAYNFFVSKMPLIVSPLCSSIYANGIMGRNLDWTYDENVSFLVKTPRNGFRYASVGMAGGINLTKQFVETGDKSDLYSLVPFFMQDGINENGVMVSTNVVPREHGDNKYVEPTGAVENTVCSIMLPRFILDNFKTASEAVDYIMAHVRTFTPTTLIGMGYEQHFLIADKDISFVLEFSNGAYTLSNRTAITNFYINDVNFNSDGTVNTPETSLLGRYATQNNITLHGQGLERYNLINASYASLNTPADFKTLLQNLYYTKSYSTSDTPSNPFWYTEAVDGQLTVDSKPADFAVKKAAMGQAYLARTRNGETWQTVHSSIYDTFARKMYLAEQEGQVYREYDLDFDYTNEDIDEMLAEKQNVLTAGQGIDITDDVISATTTAAAWGNITGTLSDQTDLNDELEDIRESKQDTLTAGDNITISNNEISAVVPELLTTTGQSETAGMTQKAITDALESAGGAELIIPNTIWNISAGSTPEEIEEALGGASNVAALIDACENHKSFKVMVQNEAMSVLSAFKENFGVFEAIGFTVQEPIYDLESMPPSVGAMYTNTWLFALDGQGSIAQLVTTSYFNFQKDVYIEGIEQNTGYNENYVMSQKAVTDEFDKRIIFGGTSEPTTATVGQVSTLYVCVVNLQPKMYICTDVTGGTYTWTEFSGGSHEPSIDPEEQAMNIPPETPVEDGEVDLTGTSVTIENHTLILGE